LAAAGKDGLLQIMAVTHTGMTVEDFTKTVLEWTKTAQHPRFHRTYTELVYSANASNYWPICALNGFKTFIVSGGGVEFIAAVDRERSTASLRSKWSARPAWSNSRRVLTAKPELMKLAKIEFVDDGPASPSASTASSAEADLRVRNSDAICRCCNGPRREQARASPGSCITQMKCVNTSMTGLPKLESSTKRWTGHGEGLDHRRHEAGLEDGVFLKERNDEAAQSASNGS